jgi:hypothetical protein
MDNVPIIFIPENMTGFQHTHLEQAVKHFPNCYTLYEKNKEKAGIRKDKELTQSYVEATVDIIDREGFILEEKWETVFGFNGTKNALLTELQNQLLRYGYDEKQRLTGKFGGKFKDDLCIAFMMAVYWSRVLELPLQRNPYRELINKTKQRRY